MYYIITDNEETIACKEIPKVINLYSIALCDEKGHVEQYMSFASKDERNAYASMMNLDIVNDDWNDGTVIVIDDETGEAFANDCVMLIGYAENKK